MEKYISDIEIEGQMSITDIFEPPDRMVAVSNIFARARKQMSLAEQKTFVLALSQLKWTKAPNEQSNIVYLDKKILQQVLDYTSDSSDISQHIWAAIKQLSIHSYIEVNKADKECYSSGVVIAKVDLYKNYVRVKFEEEYFSLFTGLGERYITLWSRDIFKMTNKRSVQFYELLRQISYSENLESDGLTYSYGWGIREFKEMFDIPKEGKGSYMRKNGHFDRTNFERYVLDPLCEDLLQCKMIQLIIQSNGRGYQKVKRGNRVSHYQFYWTLSQRPAVADAQEVKEIQESIDKNPVVLKVAKDLIKGKEHKKQNQNTFHNFEARQYDFDEIEHMLNE